MATYLARYLAGEREQVWAELDALGAAVREEPLYADALAVARETMRRVRSNIETLVARLRDGGYWSAYKESVYAAPTGEVEAEIARLEALIGGPLPISLRTFYELVGTVNLMGTHPDWPVEGYPSRMIESAESIQWRTGNHWHPDLDRSLKPKEVVCTDPLVVEPIDAANGEYESDAEGAEWVAEHGDSRMVLVKDGLAVVASGAGPVEALVDQYPGWELKTYKEVFGGPKTVSPVVIAPDFYHKAEISGGPPYAVTAVDSHMDGLLVGAPYGLTFVSYLRLCFAWGGFPGFADQIEEQVPALIIGQLRAGLLAI